MQVTAAAHKRRYCMSCGFDGETSSTACPQCRRRLRTTTEARISGVLQTFAGALLIGLMGYIGVWMFGVIQEGRQTGHSRFTGTDQQLMIIFAIVGLVIVFGVVSLLAGLWQLIAGKRNRVFIWLAAAIGVVLALGAAYVIIYF